jgi:hypothetical protein
MTGIADPSLTIPRLTDWPYLSDNLIHALPTLMPLPLQVKMIVKEEVGTRKRMLLVQAVSQFRQRRLNEAITSLQNLLSCVTLMPEDGPIPWKERGELQEVFGLFCAKVCGASRWRWR